MKVDRHIPVTVDRYVKVDRPYQVIKYVQEPFIVKVPKPFHYPVETKVSVPQPIVEVEPVIPEPQHIHREIPRRENEYLPPQAAPAQQPQNQYIPPAVEHFEPEEAIPNPLPQPLPSSATRQAPQPINQYIPPARAATPPQSNYLPPRH